MGGIWGVVKRPERKEAGRSSDCATRKLKEFPFFAYPGSIRLRGGLALSSGGHHSAK